MIVFVALQHGAFMVLEMFFWTKPLGLKVFKNTLEVAQSSQVLAANQGLYNGFISAGLIFMLLSKEGGRRGQLFFLCCVVVAGIFGGATASPTIFLVQSCPALLALALLFLDKDNDSKPGEPRS
jgi:putative membrane protein